MPQGTANPPERQLIPAATATKGDHRAGEPAGAATHTGRRPRQKETIVPVNPPERQLIPAGDRDKRRPSCLSLWLLSESSIMHDGFQGLGQTVF